MYYTDSHDWIQEDGKVGITTFARDELGEIVYVELPKIGQKVEKGEEIAILESTKAAADIYAPVSGTVTRINEVLRENPNLLNTDPEGDGWLYTLELSEPKQLDSLLDRDSYQSLT